VNVTYSFIENSDAAVLCCEVEVRLFDRSGDTAYHIKVGAVGASQQNPAAAFRRDVCFAPLRADIVSTVCQVRKVPKPEPMRCSNRVRKLKIGHPPLD
jgi:hypothetical protein